jgi:hypothetical protein
VTDEPIGQIDRLRVRRHGLYLSDQGVPPTRAQFSMLQRTCDVSLVAFVTSR